MGQICGQAGNRKNDYAVGANQRILRPVKNQKGKSEVQGESQVDESQLANLEQLLQSVHLEKEDEDEEDGQMGVKKQNG